MGLDLKLNIGFEIKNWVKEIIDMFKKYYIKSKIRFSIFIAIMTLIIGISFNSLFNLSGVYAAAKGTKTLTYYAVTVESGDTLWSIAQRYSDGRTDIRRFIYEITDLNSLETSDISIGQQLLIPA